MNKSHNVYEKDGVRLITSGRAAQLLGIHQRTVLRWIDRVHRPDTPRPLRKLVWFRDPVSGFTFFSEPSVLALQKLLKKTRPVRVRK